MKNSFVKEIACPLVPTKAEREAGRTVLDVPRHEVIDADSIQAAAEIALGRVVL